MVQNAEHCNGKEFKFTLCLEKGERGKRRCRSPRTGKEKGQQDP